MGNCVSTSNDGKDINNEIRSKDEEEIEIQHQANDSSAIQFQKRKDVPKDEHTFEEVDSDAIDIVLINSKFLHNDYNGRNDPLHNMDRNNRKLVQKAGTRVKRENSEFRRSLKLRIKLYDREDLTTDVVRYIDILSGTCENSIECYQQEDGTISWNYSKRKKVPKDVHRCVEINSDAFDIVLSKSPFLHHDYDGDNDPLYNMDQNNRKLVKDAGTRVKREILEFRRNLKLRIKLYDREGLTAHWVRYIEVSSGTSENIIECYQQEDGTLSWDYSERKAPPNDKRNFEEVNSDAVDVVLNTSPFLCHNYNGEEDPLRRVDQRNRELLVEAKKRIQHEGSTIRRNLLLRIKLYDRENLTSDTVKYIDIVSGTGENVIECYLQHDETIHWYYRKKSSNGLKLQDIPQEVYTVTEVSALRVLQIMNASQFLQHECDRRLLLEVSSRVTKEPEWKMRDCELTILLRNTSILVHDCVKHIVIKAGAGKYHIQCSNITNTEILWDCKEVLEAEQKAAEELYIFTEKEGLNIDRVLRESKFLKENKSHRTFVASVVRDAAENEFKLVTSNCKLTIELANSEGASNTPVKYIIVKVGQCGNEVRSSEHKHWNVLKCTAGASVAKNSSWLWSSSVGRVINFSDRAIACVENEVIDRMQKELKEIGQIKGKEH